MTGARTVSLPALAWRWLWSRPAAAVLNLGLLALGFGAALLLSLVAEQIEHQAQRDLAGIDLVVGAKGSPLQLILSGVFHIDVPPGNIPLATQARLQAHPQVDSVIPLSLGDSLQGWRIVGTSQALLQLYGVGVGSGRSWHQAMEAVLGHTVAQQTGLRPGQAFAGTHGLSAGGEVHDSLPYAVVGVLQPCRCVLDRLVLTDTASVWAVHEGGTALDAEDRQALEAERELTMLLVRYRTPLAAVTLPRWVQAQEGLQAAVPALESARLFRLLGVGLDLLRGLAAVLLVVAGLSVWVALTQALREREPDMAVLRLLGASPRRVVALWLCEAWWLVGLGLLGGLLIGHGLAAVLGQWLQADRSLVITPWWWTSLHLGLLPGALTLGLAAVAGPAWRAYRLDVLRALHSP